MPQTTDIDITERELVMLLNAMMSWQSHFYPVTYGGSACQPKEADALYEKLWRAVRGSEMSAA